MDDPKKQKALIGTLAGLALAGGGYFALVDGSRPANDTGALAKAFIKRDRDVPPPAPKPKAEGRPRNADGNKRPIRRVRDEPRPTPMSQRRRHQRRSELEKKKEIKPAC